MEITTIASQSRDTSITSRSSSPGKFLAADDPATTAAWCRRPLHDRVLARKRRSIVYKKRVRRTSKPEQPAAATRS